MDKPWLWLLAIVSGLCIGVLMRLHEGANATVYRYETCVEICDGVYAGRSGVVRSCYEGMLGDRTYTVQLTSGEPVFSIAEENLKAVAIKGIEQDESERHDTGY